MKNAITRSFLLSILAILFIGCGGGGGGGSGPVPPPQSVQPAPTPVVTDPVAGVDYTDPAQFLQTTVIESQLSRVSAHIAHNNGFTGGNLSETLSYTTVATDTSNRDLQTIIGVIDSGINPNHEDMLSANKIESFKDFSTNNSLTAYDNHGHGSLVSHIISGNRQNQADPYYGIAYGSHLSVAQVFENDGSGATASRIASAVDWMVTQKTMLDIPDQKRLVAMNLSLGTTSQGFVTVGLENSFKNALNNNVSTVIAAGNEGLDCLPSGGSINGKCSFPAAIPWINPAETANYIQNNGAWIVVGSVDSSNNISSFSNKAGVTKSNYLVAPGEMNVGMSATNNTGYVIGSGTSFAAPLVAGSMALMAQKWPYLKGRQHAQILFDTATDLGAAGVDDVYGNGMLNLSAAFNPVGTVVIPAGSTNVFTQSNSIGVTGTTLKTSSSILNFSSLTSLNNTIGLDSYNRDFKLNMTSNVQTTGASAIDFENFMSFNYGDMIFGVDQYQQKVMVGYKLTKDSKIKFSYDDTLLGTEGEGALSLGSAKTYYIDFEKNLYNEDDINVKFSSTYAYGKSSTAENSMITDISAIHAIGGKLNAKYKDFGIGYEIPLRTIKGEMTLTTPTGVDIDGNIIYTKTNTELNPNSFEQKYSIFYEKRTEDLAVLAKLSQTKDAFGIDNMINNEARLSLNYFY